MAIEKNTIYNECCLDTMARMTDDFIDLVVTSPPYDDMRSYNDLIKGKETRFNGYSFDFEAIAQGLYRVVKQGGVVVWVVGDKTIRGNETGTSFRQALYLKEIGFNLFDTMIYQKAPRGAVGNNTSYWQTFEYMFILSKGKPKSINLLRDRPNKEARKGDNGSKRLKDGKLKKLARGGYSEFGRRTNVWTYAVGKGHSASDELAHQHPAIFPEKLAQDHILSWSREGDVVYDPMIGSGTVAKMCKQEGRLFLGSEINKKYCELADERLTLH